MDSIVEGGDAVEEGDMVEEVEDDETTGEAEGELERGVEGEGSTSADGDISLLQSLPLDPFPPDLGSSGVHNLVTMTFPRRGSPFSFDQERERAGSPRARAEDILIRHE